MTSAGGLRAISPAEPSVACASVDIDDDEAGSEAAPSRQSLREQPDNAGDESRPGVTKGCSLTSSGVAQQLEPGGVAGGDASLLQLGRSRGIADHQDNRSEETSGAWKTERACGPGGAGSTVYPRASTGVSSRPYRQTAGYGQGHGHEYHAVDSISEGTTPVGSSPPTGRGNGVTADEGRGMVAGGPEHCTASTAAVVPCPPDACIAQEQHHRSEAADRGPDKGTTPAAATIESGVCGWERRRPVDGKKHPAYAAALVYTVGETQPDRYPSSAPALEPWSDALVEEEKLPPEVQVQVAARTREVAAKEDAEAVPPSAATTLSTTISTLSCSQRSPPGRMHDEGDVEHEREREGRRSEGDGGGVVSHYHTTRSRSCELDSQQRRREMMTTDAAADGERSRRQEHETRRSSEVLARVAKDKHEEIYGEEHQDDRTRSPPAAENAEIVPPPACASGEDTDDEPLSAAARKASRRSRDWCGERDPAAKVQSDRWMELKGSIPKLEGRVPSGTHEVSSANDAGLSGRAPALLTSYVLKPNALVHRQLADVEFRLLSPPDDVKGPLNGPAADKLDGSSTTASGEVCPDSQRSVEGRGEGSARSAVAPDRSKTTSPEDLAAVARGVPVERAPLSDVETKSSLACGEAAATAAAAASRRRNGEAENTTTVAGEMAGQGSSPASKEEAQCARDIRREEGCSRGRSGGGVGGGVSSSRSRSSSSGNLGASDVDDYVAPTIAFMPRARQHAGELSARSGVEKAAAALAAVPTAAKAAKEAAISVGRPIIPGVPPGAIMDDAETSAGEDCPVEVGIGDSGELVYSFKKSGRPRRGKWSRLEEEFAKRIINDFDDGVLDAPAGIGLRQLLASKLRCEVMRVSKKFSGWACVGKRSFRPVRYADGRAARAQASLYALEQRWLKSFVPSSTLPAKPPAFEPSCARPLPPASRSLMRLVPAPPAVERDDGVGSLKKATTPAQIWLDRARKALTHDSSTNAMASLVREGRFFVSESGERGVGGVRSGGDAGRNGTQDNGHLSATERSRLEERFPLPRVDCDSSLEARRHHSVAGAPYARNQPCATPRHGGGDDEELQWWVVHESDKASSVGASRPVYQRHRQQQQQMERDRANRSDFTRFGGEQVRPRVSDDRGVDVGGNRSDTRASPPPSPRAQYLLSDDGRERAKPYFGWTSPNQQPCPYAPPHRGAQEQPRGKGTYAREQDDNHSHDRSVESPRDVRSSWQRRQAELQQDARGSGSGIVVSAPSSPIFSRRRNDGENMDISMKLAPSMTASAAAGSVGGWGGGSTSPSTADGQDRVKVQSARQPKSRSPCTISRPNEDTEPAFTGQVGGGDRNDDYPHLRRQIVSPGEGRAGGGRGMGGGRALDRRGREGGSAYASAAWHQGSLTRPGSEFDGRKTLEGGRSGSPVATAAARRPGPFRLKPPPTLPPHLRVEHDGASFFPGDGHEEETAAGYKGYSKPPPPSPQQRSPPPPHPQQQHQQRIDSAQRRSGDGYHPGGSFDSEGEPATTEMRRSYREGENRKHQRPFKSRRVEIEVDRNTSGGGDRRYDNGYQSGYQSGHPEKRSPSEGGNSAAVAKPASGGWRQYGADRELAVEGTYATARPKPPRLADATSVADGASARASSSGVIAAHPHPYPHDRRFKFEPPHARGDRWEDSRAQESHFHRPTRGFVVPAGGHLVLRVEASPELGRSSGVIREPYAACQD